MSMGCTASHTASTWIRGVRNTVAISAATRAATRAARPRSRLRRARVLDDCSWQGASIAKVALAHGLNANLVHKWRRAAEAMIARAAALAHTKENADAFIALALPPQRAPVVLPDIRIELRLGATTVNIHWPAQGGGDCAAWLREWLR